MLNMRLLAGIGALLVCQATLSLAIFHNTHDNDDSPDMLAVMSDISNDDDNNDISTDNDDDNNNEWRPALSAAAAAHNAKRSEEDLPREPPTIPHPRITPEDFLRRVLGGAARRPAPNKRLLLDQAAYAARADKHQRMLAQMIRELLDGGDAAVSSRWNRLRNELGTALKRKTPDVAAAMGDPSGDLMTRQGRPRIQPLRWG